jgi:hypothetical protein
MRRIEDLMKLIEIPSVTGDEGRLARHLRDRLAATGRPVVMDASSLLVPPPDDSRPLVVLSGIASLLDDPRVGAGWARVGTILYTGEEGPMEENDLGRLLEGAARWAASAALAILLEPTDVHIEVGCVGLVNVEVVFRGEACHSARPWLGRSGHRSALARVDRRVPAARP